MFEHKMNRHWLECNMPANACSFHFYVPYAACPRRLCQLPWAHTTSTESTLAFRRNQFCRKTTPSASRFPGGKDSHSRQWRLWLSFSTETSGHRPRRLRLRKSFSERPPPSHYLTSLPLALRREKRRTTRRARESDHARTMRRLGSIVGQSPA